MTAAPAYDDDNDDDEAPRLPPVKGKRILLFSDGTGNSSAKLFKTNVWQMYQSVDLGPTRPGQKVQIAFYNNGVGTSSFRPLAMLGGVFGFGLKRNVLNLYRFLCRNYEEGDEIIAFGFSRGAFTVRLLIELIATERIVRYNDPARSETDQLSEAELNRQSHEAYRRMHAGWRLNNPIANWVLRITRALMGMVRRLIWRSFGLPVDPVVWDAEPLITFIGVWDTVAAYGGPVVEVTRAIDDWLWPLTMPDYTLASIVKRARHALALDDARDSFQPLLWDETTEADTGLADPRLKQVWFSGMHADVGGGYPDDSLSYVSFTWMLEEMDGHVRLLDHAVERAYELSNDFGPLHDSRQGLGSYYRYQPRRAEAFLDPPGGFLLGLCDPNVHVDHPGSKTGPRGLLRRVMVHESVFRRIIDGTDGYAPIALPRRVHVVRRDATSPHAELLPRLPDALQRDLDALADETAAYRPRAKDGPAELRDPLDLAWDRVEWRRAVYFLTVGLSTLLFLLPWSPMGGSGFILCGDDRCILPGPISALKSVLPSVAGFWIDGWAEHPGLFFIIVIEIMLSIAAGAYIETTISDKVRQIWTHATGRIARATEGGTREREPAGGDRAAPSIKPVAPSRFAVLREHPGYQRALQTIKWRITPWLVGPVMIAALLWLALAIVAQVRIAVDEDRFVFCRHAAVVRDAHAPLYLASRPCNRTGIAVKQGTGYTIMFAEVPDPASGKPGWSDGGPIGDPVEATLDGVAADDLTLPMYLAAPFRRVIPARELQPIAAIRKNDRTTSVTKLKVVERRMGGFVATFTASSDGELMLFANDVIPPFGPLDLFMRDNRGAARVTVK